MPELYADHDRRKRLREIYHIAFLLRQRLVPDVISAIMIYAELFEPHHLYTCRMDPVLVAEQYSSPRRCIKTPPIMCTARVKRPVRKVTFDIEAHDQGWAGDMNAGSWTWFIAQIERQDESDAPQQEQPEESSLPSEREIVRNPIAQREFTHHHVEWRADSDDVDEAKWVSSLVGGDLISVHALARYTGWINYVRSVSVTVHTVAII